MTEDLFNVVQFFSDGTSEYVRRGVPAREAVEVARDYTRCVGAQIGTTVRVIITDSGDSTVFEWCRNDGVVFPPPAEPPVDHGPAVVTHPRGR